MWLFCFYSCKTYYSDNARRIRSIDEIKVIDTTYEFLIDFKDRIIDTISMYCYKKNENGSKVFSEITSLKNGTKKTILKNYFRENGELFYSVTETPAGVLSVYENWIQDSLIFKAYSVNYELGKVTDTVTMIYKYEYNGKGKLKKLRINESNGSQIVEVHYNLEQKPILGIYTYFKDTTSIESFTYESSKLISKKILNKRNGSKTLRYYADDEFVAGEKVYINDTLTKELIFKSDVHGNILAKLIQ